MTLCDSTPCQTTWVQSNLNIEIWKKNLKDYYDRDICQYLLYGRPANFTGTRPPEPTYKNHASATLHASQLDKFIKKEVSLGAMIGPLDKAPLAPWTQTSPIMTRPKKDSENRRVIVGLSFLLGLSVNDGIAPHCIQNIPYEYCLISITDLTS